MTLRYRYSEWDGTQEDPPLDPDNVLGSLSDDLMNSGDLQRALRNMLQRGMRLPDGSHMQGLRDLLQHLRQQRRQTLDRFDLGSVFDEIQRQLDEIIDLERDTLDERWTEAERLLGGSNEGSAESPAEGRHDQSGESDPERARGEPGGERSPAADRRRDDLTARGPEGRRPEDGDPGPAGADDSRAFAAMLRGIVERKQQFLDSLPEDIPGRMRELTEYEFMNPEAREKYQQLLDSLRRQMLNTVFRDLAAMIQNMSPEDLERMRQMVQDLNTMLRQRSAGEEPDFAAFMAQYGDLFGDAQPQSLDELIAELQRQGAMMRNLVDSLPGDLRQQLQDLLSDRMGALDLQDELTELAASLEEISPMGEMRNQYPFRGDEQLDLQAAMNLMGEMQDVDELERQLERTQYGGDLEGIDTAKLEELLGAEAREALDQLKALLEILETAGYIRRKGNAWELTPRGTCRIGQRALAEVYANLKQHSFGAHKVAEYGRAGERTDDTKPYEFGDPFQLDLKQTLMNAIHRTTPSVPVELHPDDFDVYRSETLTQTATVLMLDLSWSMALRGSFQAAKKVALALEHLIRVQYPRDSLYLVGFSAYARELKQAELPYARWDETVMGTNMHHALIIAQRLLARHKVGNRQIIMVSDGELTAHLEHGRSYFAYPPSPVTIRETLKEVRSCAKQEIVLNIFMLDRNYYLKEFVNQLARINRGRVFYTTPDRLGEYILVDFVGNKRTRLRTA